MLKKIIYVVLGIMLAVFTYNSIEYTNVKPIGNRNTYPVVDIASNLNGREMRVYEEFGAEVAYCMANLRKDCEFYNYTIINEYVDILENDYEVVVRVQDKFGDKYEYFQKIPK